MCTRRSGCPPSPGSVPSRSHWEEFLSVGGWSGPTTVPEVSTGGVDLLLKKTKYKENVPEPFTRVFADLVLPLCGLRGLTRGSSLG